MKTISDKLDLITEVWNYFFLEVKFCQSQINFTEEVKTNYYGDILFMFNDTIRTLNNIEYTLSFEKSILQTFGLMQVIYIQQDLIDELLYIFNLASSTTEDKNPNRTIRNELIGHPIRREKKENKLISSVIFGRNLSNDTLHYIIYSRKTKFSGVDKIYKIQEILERHNLYLHKYLDIILAKIKKILFQLTKKLNNIQNMLDKQISVDKVIRFVEQNFGNFADSFHLYHQGFIDECIKREDEHPRYKNVLVNCRRDLINFTIETHSKINELLKEGLSSSEVSYIKHSSSIFKIQQNTIKKSMRNYSYEYSKLYSKNHIFSIDYFKKEFLGDQEILDELNNIQVNNGVEIEFYSSIAYLRLLLENRGML